MASHGTAIFTEQILGDNCIVHKRSDLLDKVRVAAGRDVRHEPPGFAHVTIVVWTVYMLNIRFVQIN